MPRSLPRASPAPAKPAAKARPTAQSCAPAKAARPQGRLQKQSCQAARPSRKPKPSNFLPSPAPFTNICRMAEINLLLCFHQARACQARRAGAAHRVPAGRRGLWHPHRAGEGGDRDARSGPHAQNARLSSRALPTCAAISSPFWTWKSGFSCARPAGRCPSAATPWPWKRPTTPSA